MGAMPRIEVRNATRQSVLGGRVAVARTHWTRLRGMLGRPAPEPGEGLLIVPCRGVHMYGMKYALDLVFLDEEGTVVHVRSDLQPGTRTGFIKGSHYALEIPTGTIEASGTQVGDKLVWQPIAEDRVLGGTAEQATHAQPEAPAIAGAAAASDSHALSRP
jgi:uncharacterized membrane protein (UPF0127 family)